MSFHTAPIQNYLTNSTEFLDQFRDGILDTYDNIANQIEKKPWGGLGVKQQLVPSGGQLFPSREPVKDFLKLPPKEKAERLAATIATGEAAKNVYKHTNLPIKEQDFIGGLTARAGINPYADPLAAAVITKGAPFLAGYLAGRVGHPADSFRPKGEKAVYPKSKEEDPTGREVGNPLAEAIGRTVFFQRGQLLPYGEFKKERPDVLPSTYRDYMRYQYAKPEAGSLVTIDPKGASFTALGGAVRGSARGLNDPELRVRGFKTTAGEAAGIAAGYQAMRATTRFLGKQGTVSADYDDSSFTPNVQIKPEYLQTTATGQSIKNIPVNPETQQQIRDTREQNLIQFKKDVEDIYKQEIGGSPRTLSEAQKTAGDRLQSIRMRRDESVIPGNRNFPATRILMDPGDDKTPPTYASRMTKSSKEIKGNKIVDSGPKPYNEFRVGIKGEKDPAKRAMLQDAIQQGRTESQRRASIAAEEIKKNTTTGQRIEAFLSKSGVEGSMFRPYIGAAVGAAAALGAAYAVRKTTQALNERRAKKQDPVEYLKYKHGSFADAKTALKQPNARSYQDLIPYVK
mgnify:FL=1